MPQLRSRTTTHGRNAAGARALWRATGMTDSDFGKPIVAIANSYTQFVPGHVHLRDLGDIVAEAHRARPAAWRASSTPSPSTTASPWATAGCSTRCPRREVIADSVEYMVNAHAADALVCISNCDKITPGMLNAAMRLNIPDVFVSGGPMEAGKAVVVDGVAQRADRPDHRDLRVRVPARRRRRADRGRALRVPDVRLVLRHVHRELDELPDRGARPGAARQRLHAGHARRAPRAVLARPAAPSWSWPRAGTATTTRPRCRAPSPPARRSRTRWRSTWRWAARPTPCCTSSPPRRRARSTSRSHDIDDVSPPGAVPVEGVAELRLPHGGRAPGRRNPRASSASCTAAGLLNDRRAHRAHAVDGASGSASGTSARQSPSAEAVELFHAAPGGVRTTEAFSTSNRWSSLDTDAAGGCIRDVEHAYTA